MACKTHVLILSEYTFLFEGSGNYNLTPIAPESYIFYSECAVPFKTEKNNTNTHLTTIEIQHLQVKA